MVLGGCSRTILPTKQYKLTVYKPPAPIKLHLVGSKGDKEYIKSLEYALTKLVTKVRVQQKIIKAYEKEVKEANDIKE